MLVSFVSQLFSAILDQAVMKDLYSGLGAQLYELFAQVDLAECDEVGQVGELIPPRSTVGELAAGEGRLLFSLPADKVETYVAFDTSPVLLNALKQRATKTGVAAERLQVVSQDITQWAPNSASFDLLILGAGTIRLFPEDQRKSIYSATYSALKSGGYFYISTAESTGRKNGLICLGQLQLQGRSVVAYFGDIYLENQEARETSFTVFPVGQRGIPRIYNSLVYDMTSERLLAELKESGFTLVKTFTKEYEDPNRNSEKLTSLIMQKGA